MTDKQCSHCRVVKPLAAFHKQARGKGGRAACCADCFNAEAKVARGETVTPEDRRRWNVSTRYRLTLDQVEEMKVAQGGVCAICARVPKRWHIDHCHDTGRVRGMLCQGCNIKLRALDDATFYAAAKRYLAR